MIYDISQDLLTAVIYEGDPAPRIHELKNIESGDPYNLTALYACNHTGTHIDAPNHFLEGASSIDSFPLDLFVGECRVIETKQSILTGADVDDMKINGAVRVILKSGGLTRLTRSAAFVFASEGVKLLGMDSITIGTESEDAAVHRELGQADIAILEGLVLEEVRPGDYVLCAAPIKISGTEAAPCRALLIGEDVPDNR